MSSAADQGEPQSERIRSLVREVAELREPHRLMEGFPEADLVGDLKSTWRSSAMSIYRNWLQYVASKKAEAMAFPAMAVLHDLSPRKRSALR